MVINEPTALAYRHLLKLADFQCAPLHHTQDGMNLIYQVIDHPAPSAEEEA